MPILTGLSIDKQDISYLEGHFSVAFPDDYKDFLKKYNGYRIVAPDYCDLPFDKVDNDFISFDALLGYKTSNSNFDIVEINEELLDEISFIDGALIIGMDPSDNGYVLITKNNLAGVYYWDRTCLHAEDNKQSYDISDDDDLNHLYLINKTFSDFFGSIMNLTVNKGMKLSTGL